MGALPVLEVAIGLCFVYLLLALIVTTVTEWLSRVRNSRGRVLEDGIRRLLGEERHDSPLTKAVLGHPLVQSLSSKGSRPSYIPSEIFAQVLADVMQPPDGGPPPDLPQDSKESRQTIIPEALDQSLRTLRTALQFAEVRNRDPRLPDPEVLEQWYDNQMERVSGWYKRHTQTIVFIASVVVTVAANADTVSLSTRLWTDSALRSTVVESAKARIALGPPLEVVEYTDPTSPEPTEPIKSEASSETTESEDANNLSADEKALLAGLMGWSGERDKLRTQGLGFWLLFHAGGWLVTALAVSLGAPFWFDTLNRFINIRAAGPPPRSTIDPKAR